MRIPRENRIKTWRILEIDRMIRDGGYPDVRQLAGHFEVSRATICRDIEFLRDFYHAPLEFDRTRHGYFYSDVRSFLIFASGLALCYYLPGSHRKQAFVWLGWAVALYLSLLSNGVNTCSY